MSHSDIRIGTLVGMENGPKVIKQVLPYGFESFGISFWQYIKDVNIKETAKRTLEACGDQATISCVGLFSNPLIDPQSAKDLPKVIDAVKLFNCDIFSGFAGAIEGKPLPESMEAFTKFWKPLAKRAADNGVRIAFENCDMGGSWESPKFNIAHSPTAWEMIFDALGNPDNVGLQWEPCHQMVSLVDPLPQLRKWIKKIFHVHGKDATIAWDVLKETGLRGGKPWVWHRTPGFGDTNWTDVITILRQAKWTGAIDIEGYHDPVYRDKLEWTGQVRGLNYLKQCRGGDFVPNPET